MYIIPSQELKLEDKIEARKHALDLLTSMIKARGKDPAQYVVRDILPKTDLGLAAEEWKITFTKAYEWERKVNIKLEQDKFIVFYGYQNNSAVPKTLAVKFFVDVKPIEVIQVENLYTYDEPIGFFTPLGWMENETLGIDFYGNSAGDDYPVLRGFVAELKNKTISPRE
jgi:hypothetical protein